MEAWFLREWQRNSPWQILLRPLSWVFAVLAGMRRACYRAGILRRTRLSVPVIVVGNISVGGTGKTPVVLAIAELLARHGWHCGIISRGYVRGSANSSEDVMHVKADAFDTGALPDEALLLARRASVPVYVAANRATAASALLHAYPQVDVLICDDGLQHYALERDLEICVIDGARGFGNGALLPAGPLREPVSRLGHVDAIVVNGPDPDGKLQLRDIAPKVPTYSMSLGNEMLVHLADERIVSIEHGLSEFSGKTILAAAGTGHPSRFFTHLARLGFRLDKTRAFADHHPFASGDFADAGAAIILMTEKDAVKCKGFADERMWFMRVDAILPDAFSEFVVQRMPERKKLHVT